MKTIERIGRCLGLLFAAMACLALSSAPSAASSERSEELIREGLELRRAGRDADALEKFERAYAVAKTPRAAGQLGLCLQALGRWSEADPRLAEALTGANDPWVKKNRETLKDSLETVKTHVARLEILGQPVGARVLINGRPVGVLPLKQAVLVNEGVVDVEVAAEGHRTSVRNLTAVGTSYQSLVFRLESEKLASPTAVSLVPSSQPPGSDSIIGKSATSPAEPNRSSGWLWLGAGTLIIGATVVVWLLTSSAPTDPKVDKTFRFE